MSNQRYTPEFKDEAVRQVVDRGYRVAEVAERLILARKMVKMKPGSLVNNRHRIHS